MLNLTRCPTRSQIARITFPALLGHHQPPGTEEFSSGPLHWYGDDHPSAHEWKATVDTAVAALAAKQGLDKDTVMSDYREKADKKFAATARKSLRELKQHRGDIVVDDLMPGLQAWIRDNGIPA